MSSDILKWWTFIFVIQFIELSTTLEQYRTDYVYNRQTRAFYKFHMETRTFAGAQEICYSEGATLMMANHQEDISQAHGMFKQYPDIGDVAWVGNDGNQYESAEETPQIITGIDVSINRYAEIFQTKCDGIQRNGEVQRFHCYHSYPFVCKVDAKDVYGDMECKVSVKGYRYFEKVGSCYKVPNMALSWNEAYSACRAEGAHLLVLNSEIEHQTISNIIREKRNVAYAKVPYYFIVGIRTVEKKNGAPWRTIFDQTLEEAGFSQWDKNEPNNAAGTEYCGTVVKDNGNYNDVDCNDVLTYICEKEVHNTK